jgi:hypothetical protein
MLLQPETRPISQDQLVIEIKWIYVGLAVVKKNFIVIDNRYDHFPFMNEKCFSADCPCWRYSSIPVMDLWSFQLELPERSWIGTQLSKQLLHRRRDELGINLLYLEAYD